MPQSISNAVDDSGDGGDGGYGRYEHTGCFLTGTSKEVKVMENLG